MLREVIQEVTGSIQYDGAGVRLVRVIGSANVKSFDPFLMLDAFDSTDSADYTKGFPWHPHRGIETVTYLISGQIEHGDSIGNKGTIQDGCCQWMTAGSGIMHQEMPRAAERMLGVQLWLNMPADKKMSPPRYHDIAAAMIPRILEDGATVGVVGGTYRNVPGAAQGEHVKVQFLDVEVRPGSEWTMATNPADTLFAYIVEGEGIFGTNTGKPYAAHRALLMGAGETFAVRAVNPLRMLLLSGKPIGEPVAWGGPIVMNTREELRQAFDELDRGTFIRHPGKG
jgi:quercetin 2,3-dioxygenase